MKDVVAVIIVAALACGTVLWTSVYPGALEKFSILWICLAVVLVPALLIFGPVAAVVVARKGEAVARRAARCAVIVLAMVATTGALVWLNVPRRAGFAMSRGAFEQWIAQARTSDYQGEGLNRSLGLFRVDRYAADPRGGVYFRVGTGSDGLGPDLMSYGFVYRPNPKGSPFGASQYALHTLGGDWYSFRASDDWY